MRKALAIAALFLLVFLWGITAWSVVGPNPLPARIPTHFNAAGQPDGWGTPGMLWLMPVVALGIYLLMTWAARQTAPAGRRQLGSVALSMIAWLKLEVVGLFAWIQYETVKLALRGEGALPALFLPAVLAVILGTIAWHITAMRRMGH
jgi:uncharacterized membrane protein